MKRYSPSEIESKWQAHWQKERIYEPDLKAAKRPAEGEASHERPFYNLMMFPYPSAEGLHIGAVRTFSGVDIYGRYKRMQSYDVFEPIGLDGFGIHSENYALKIGKHPREHARDSEKNFYRQLSMIGNGFAWEEKLETYDPKYYRWTQWIFVQMFKRGLAYRKKSPVNWCPSCKTVLADEQVIGGACERCGTQVIKKELEQWFFKITDYAERLLRNLEKLDWTEKVKTAQRNWIGRAEGTEIQFLVKNTDKHITVVTTRADTIFGATFVTIAPEHGLIDELKPLIQNYTDVERYRRGAAAKTDFERGLLAKEKTGIKLEGVMAVNPVNGAELPIFVSDFVLITYGTGAIMSVPAHDERDFKFAKKFHLPIVSVIEHPRREALGVVLIQIYDEDSSNVADQIRKLGRPLEYATPTVRVYEVGRNNIEALIAILQKERIGQPEDYDAIRSGEDFKLEIQPRSVRFLSVYTGNGAHIHSDFLDGLQNDAAIEKMNEWLREHRIGGPVIHYRLRDWLVSRQRYWGPPIPMIFCEACHAAGKGERSDMPGWYSVLERDLPVELPYVENFQPTGTGVGPLASVKSFYEVTCPVCGAIARRETDVSDVFLDSAWYFLRYPSVRDEEHAWDPETTKRWLPVHSYIGGAEHSVLHLLYARFLTMVFHDWGLLDFEEPFRVFRAHGLITREGAKMSKSKGNVVNPDEYITAYGIDAIRMYLAFMAPLTDSGDFRDTGIRGMTRFLERVWKFFQELHEGGGAEESLQRILHRTIKKVGDDIEALRYNTAISALMTLLNALEEQPQAVNREASKTFLKLLAPFAPFIAEELWHILGEEGSIHRSAWPTADPRYLETETTTLVVQINGKVRDRVTVARNATEEEVRECVLTQPKVQEWLKDRKVKKFIYVPGRVFNVVLA